MQEHQVTIGGVSHPLPELFMVMATQNPLDQAGTYPLPEAQLDRFLLHVVLDYPTETEELEILRRHRAKGRTTEEVRAQVPQIDVAWVLTARSQVSAVHIAPELETWIVHLVAATRDMASHVPEAAGQIECGASPRASLALAHAAQALAFLRGRDFVTPEDLLDIAPDALRHRLLLSPVGQLARVNRDALIAQLCDAFPIV
jgi:MoxR-like ATPase